MTGGGARILPEAPVAGMQRAGGAMEPRSFRVASAILLGITGWLLATGRWGSYIGAPHKLFYISDVAVAAATVCVLLHWRLALERLQAVRRSPLAVVTALLLAWCMLRLATGLSVSHDGIRDIAPYLYLIVAGLVIVTRSWERVRDWHVVLVFTLHAAWVHESTRLLDLHPPMLGPIAAFSLRSDFEGAVAGIATAYSVARLASTASNAGRASWLAFAAVNAYVMTQQQNRASLLATIVAVAVAAAGPLLVVVTSPRWSSTGRRSVLVLGSLSALVVIVALGARSAAGEKVIHTFSGAPGSTGTVDARRQVYSIVVDYVTASPGRTTWGVGFGPDYLSTTGAVKLLEGTDYTGVRAPHDVLVGTFARVGLLGLVLHASLLLLGIWLGTRVLRRPQPSAGLSLAAIIAVAIPVVSLLGVILESPFGAVPYAWAVGTLVVAGSQPRPEAST